MSFDDENDLSPMDRIENILDEVPKNIRAGIPELDLLYEGNKTIINDFNQLKSDLSREGYHISKFISKSLGVKSTVKGTQLQITGHIPKEKITKAMQKYVELYITCNNCGKPDTVLYKKGKKFEKDCLACGHQLVVE